MRHRLLVLLPGERVDRAELLAPARAAAPRAPRGPRAPRRAAARRPARRSRPKPPCQLAELALHVGGRVARLLGGDLALRDRLARAPAACPGARPPRARRRAARRRSARRPRRPPRAPRPAPSRLASTAASAASSARAARSAARVRSASASMPVLSATSVFLRSVALALGALRHPPLGAEVGGQPGAAHAVRSLLGALAPALEQPLRPLGRVARLGVLARRAPERRLGLLARGVGAGHRLGGGLDCGPRLASPRPPPPRSPPPADRAGRAPRAGARRRPAGAWESSPVAASRRRPERVTATPRNEPDTESSDSTTHTSPSSRSASRATPRLGRHVRQQARGAGHGRPARPGVRGRATTRARWRRHRPRRRAAARRPRGPRPRRR